MIKFLFTLLLFFLFYWIFLWFGTTFFGSDLEISWSLLGAESWGWKITYYLAPFFSFLIASVVSGVIQNSNLVKRFPWNRILIFIIIFGIVDIAVLFAGSVPWYSLPKTEQEPRYLLYRILFFHEFAACAFGIIFATRIMRKVQSQLAKNRAVTKKIG